MTKNHKIKQTVLVLICSVISFALDFFIIPNFFAKGVPDFIWIALMILLPAVAAVLLLRVVYKCSPCAVFLGLPLQLVLAIVLSQPIGNMLSYNLGGFAEDFFDWISYIIFTFGWTIGATATQFAILWLAKKLESKRQAS